MPVPVNTSTYSFPVGGFPEWSGVSGNYPDIQYQPRAEDPYYGKASFYGKFDGTGLTDYTSCRQISLADGRLFNPFKLYIASRDIKRGSFVKVTLLDGEGIPIRDQGGQEIFVLAEVVDWGPQEVSGRDFDLSYGIAEYFSRKAEGQREFVREGKILKGGVDVKVELVDLEPQDINVLRAFTFYHKVLDVDPQEKRERTWCLNIEERDDGSWVTPSLGDKLTIGWQPHDQDLTWQWKEICDYDQCRCYIRSVYQFCSPAKEAVGRKQAWTDSFNNRLHLMQLLGLQKFMFNPFIVDTQEGERCYGSDLGPLGPKETIYLFDTLEKIDRDYGIAGIQCFSAEEQVAGAK